RQTATAEPDVAGRRHHHPAGTPPRGRGTGDRPTHAAERIDIERNGSRRPRPGAGGGDGAAVEYSQRATVDRDLSARATALSQGGFRTQTSRPRRRASAVDAEQPPGRVDRQ